MNSWKKRALFSSPAVTGIFCFQVSLEASRSYGHILTGIVQLVDDTVLDIGLRENRMDSRIEPCEVVCLNKENVLYTITFQPI